MNSGWQCRTCGSSIPRARHRLRLRGGCLMPSGRPPIVVLDAPEPEVVPRALVDGACRLGDNYLIFDDEQRVEDAKRICRECPVAQLCLAYALNNEPYGVWGGTTLAGTPRISRRRRSIRPVEETGSGGVPSRPERAHEGRADRSQVGHDPAHCRGTDPDSKEPPMPPDAGNSETSRPSPTGQAYFDRARSVGRSEWAGGGRSDNGTLSGSVNYGLGHGKCG